MMAIRDLAAAQQASMAAGGANGSNNSGNGNGPRLSFAGGLSGMRQSRTAGGGISTKQVVGGPSGFGAGPNQQPGGRGGGKAAVLSASEEAQIEKTAVDLCRSALATRTNSDAFEEAFHTEVRSIFVDTVMKLRERG